MSEMGFMDMEIEGLTHSEQLRIQTFFKETAKNVVRMVDLTQSKLPVEWVGSALLKQQANYYPHYENYFGVAAMGKVDGRAVAASIKLAHDGTATSIVMECDCQKGVKNCAHLYPLFVAFADKYQQNELPNFGEFQDISEIRHRAREYRPVLETSHIGEIASQIAARGKRPRKMLKDAQLAVCAVRRMGPDGGMEFAGCLLQGSQVQRVEDASFHDCLVHDGNGEQARRTVAMYYALQEALFSIQYNTDHHKELKQSACELGVVNVVLRELANQGALVDGSGRSLSYEDDPAALFHWQVMTPTQQKLRLLPEALLWSEEGVVGLDVVSRKLHFFRGGADALHAINRWPPLANAEVDAVAKAIQDADLLIPVPQVVDVGVVEEITARWAVVLELDQQDTTRIQGRLVAIADGLELPHDAATTGLQRREERWVSLTLPPSPIDQFNQKTKEFTSSTRNLVRHGACDFHCYLEDDVPFYANRLSTALIDAGFEVIYRGMTPITVISYPASRSVPAPRIHVGVTDSDGMHPLRVEMNVDKQAIEPERLLKMTLLHRVLELGWMGTKSPPSWTNTIEVAAGVYLHTDLKKWALALLPYIHLYASANKQGKVRKASRAAVMAAVLGGAAMTFENPADDPKSVLAALRSAKAGPGIAAVPEINITYLPFQQQGLDWLLTLRRHGYSGVLGDDRGCGKTLQALGAGFLHRATSLPPKGRGRPGVHAKRQRPPLLVVVERRDAQVWRDELNKHAPSVDWVWHASGKRAKTAEELGGRDLVLTTYGVLSRDIELFLELAPEMVFLDEANSLKNPDSAKSRDVARFAGATLVPITGTPGNHNPRHLHALLNTAMPGLLGRRDDFVEMQRLIGKAPDNDVAEAERLRVAAVIAPFMLRRLKAELGDQFPPKHEVPSVLTLDRKAAENYRTLQEAVNERRIALLETQTFSESRFQLNAMLDQLRKWCAKVGTPRNPTIKGQYLLDLVREERESGAQIVVFSHFNSEVIALAEILRHAGINAGVWVGQDDPKQRDREYKLFKDGHTDVLVVGAYGARGLDLPEATVCIIADPWIDITTDDQMGDRVHRISSKQRVTIFRVATAGTIEQVAMEFAQQMTHASESVLTGAAPPPARSASLGKGDYDRMFEAAPECVVD